MALITPGAMTYSEWALRHDQSGKISTLVNMLSQTNGMLDDMLAVECTSGNAFEYTQVVKIPTIGRRIYNQGVPRTLAGVAKLTTTAVEYADWSVLDVSLAELNGDLAQLRTNEISLHMQALMQRVASDLFYSDNTTDPTAFTGLANVYNTVSTATSQIANNVIDCGGTGTDNTSMWLVSWGPKTIHTIYPKGTQAGMYHRPYDLLPTVDANSNEFPAYRDWLAWKIGLAIHDWRFGVRACNIDVSNLAGGSAANLITTLLRMVHRPPVMPVGVAAMTQMTDSTPDQLVPGRAAIYVNRTIASYLDQQALNKTNVLLQMQQWGGQSVTTFRGIPIRISDAILDTESRVV